MLDHGSRITSPGGGFIYTIQGPVCRLFDREELPWPCCRLSWKGREPSWNRIGCRFVADLGSNRFESYAVSGLDAWGTEWTDVQTFFFLPKLSKQKAKWWYWKHVPNQKPADFYVES